MTDYEKTVLAIMAFGLSFMLGILVSRIIRKTRLAFPRKKVSYESAMRYMQSEEFKKRSYGASLPDDQPEEFEYINWEANWHAENSQYLETIGLTPQHEGCFIADTVSGECTSLVNQKTINRLGSLGEVLEGVYGDLTRLPAVPVPTNCSMIIKFPQPSELSKKGF